MNATTLRALRADCSVTVFAPSPVVTVTVERGSNSAAEIHFHGGGQGFWVARMAVTLGARVALCAPLGGESGRVLRALAEGEGIELRGVPSSGWNGAYIHDRRGGERRTVAEAASAHLQRHETDELYGVALAEGLDSDVTLFTGPQTEAVLDCDVYRRLASDLRANGRPVLADLTRRPLAAALTAGVDVLKLSDEELLAEGLATSRDLPSITAAAEALHRRGAVAVVVSRGPEPVVALVGGRLLELAGPRFTALDPAGTGDAMFAALGVGIGNGLDTVAALRLAMAAGALNATRHGLGSGHRAEIERIARHVDVRELGAASTG